MALSGWGIPFISAKASYSSAGENPLVNGEVVCETQEQCDAIAARAAQEGWSITTRVASPDEVLEAKYWSER